MYIFKFVCVCACAFRKAKGFYGIILSELYNLGTYPLRSYGSLKPGMTNEVFTEVRLVIRKRGDK